MDKLKRILALAAVVILVGIYVLTLVFALLDSPHAQNWLYASLGATVLIPTTLYIYLWIYRLLNDKDEQKKDED